MRNAPSSEVDGAAFAARHANKKTMAAALVTRPMVAR